MLTSTTEYDYIDWEDPILNDAESPQGNIMPIEDQLSAGHALRYEDFQYLYEAITQIQYNGVDLYDGTLTKAFEPSISAQNYIARRVRYLSCYFQSGMLSSSVFQWMCIRDGEIQAEDWWVLGTSDSQWNNRPWVSGLKLKIPETALIDCSGLDIDLDPDVIDDELMMAMYGVLSNAWIYNVTMSFQSITNWGSGRPELGPYSFSGTKHNIRYNEDGTEQSHNTQYFSVDQLADSWTHGSIIVNRFDAVYYIGSVWYSTSTQTGQRYLYGRIYIENARVTLTVPKDTTDCWIYVTVCSFDTPNNNVWVGKIYQASLNGQTATITGFANSNEIDTIRGMMGQSSSEVNLVYTITAVFCKVDAKWHWW